MTKDVLVVDDEVLVGLQLAAALERAGFRAVGPAANGNEALSLARGRPPWLALVDIDLPAGMDGVELARRLREVHGCACLFLTAWPERAHAGREVAVGFIEKPYNTGLVVRAVQALADAGEGLRSRPGSVYWFADPGPAHGPEGEPRHAPVSREPTLRD